MRKVGKEPGILRSLFPFMAGICPDGYVIVRTMVLDRRSNLQGALTLRIICLTL